MNVAEKLIKIADNVQKNVEFGKSQGGGGDGFWDAFMNMKSFSYAFYNWDTDVFKPNKELMFKGDCSRAFYYFNSDKTETVDMIEHLKKCGASLNFSNTTGSLTFIFGSSKISALPTLDFSKATKLESCFNNAPIETIEKIILKADGSQTFTNLTFQCRASATSPFTLRNIAFEGVIGNDIWFDVCPNLTAESYHSIMTHLSTTATGVTITFTAYETVKATYDAKYGEGAWDILAASKTNWTIAYS